VADRFSATEIFDSTSFAYELKLGSVMKKSIIALDADGVLLDYHLAYADVWEKVFQYRPRERDPLAYWPMDRWEVTQLASEHLSRLRNGMDENFWSTLPAIEGALVACHSLNDAGYELVCVSALPKQFGEARLRNLRKLGFPIERVIATDRIDGVSNPKIGALRELRPIAFVDDYLPFLMGLPQEIHAALVLRVPNGSPNTGPDLDNVQSTHENLATFAKWWLSNQIEK
jgi:hypothetical protein